MRSFRSKGPSTEPARGGKYRTGAVGASGLIALSLVGMAAAAPVATPTLSGWSSVVVHGKTGAITPAQERTITTLGGYVVRHLPLIDSVAVRIPRRSAEKLAALSFVGHVSDDGMVVKHDAFTYDSSQADTAAQQYPSIKGDGVTVAVVDTGVADVDDLRSDLGLGPRILASQNFVSDDDKEKDGGGVSIGANVGTNSGDGGSGGLNVSLGISLGITTSPEDPCGHGTHIAGIIAGNGFASANPLKNFQTFRGIAPRANIVSVRVLDSQGRGTVSGVIAGIQWAVANKAKYKIRVLNLSLGHPVGESYTTDPLCQAVEKAWKAGIVVVCAAGNDGRYFRYTVTPGADNGGYGTKLRIDPVARQ